MPHAHRRARLLAALGPRTASMLPAGVSKTRSRTTRYRFRPDSDFWYLTGFAEPEAVLVLLPGHPEHETVLFLRDRDPMDEAWHGPRLGVEAAPAALGVEAAYPISELAARVGAWLLGYDRLCYPLGHHPEWDSAVLGWIGPGADRRDAHLEAIVHPRALLHPMRVRKDAHDLAGMRRAAAATAAGHAAVVAMLAPGVREHELEAAALAAFGQHGASAPAYEPIVASGPRATVLHAPATERAAQAGELLLVDVGAEVDGYACDVTRTLPVSGTYSEAQRAVVDIVLAAQQAAIAALVPGAPVSRFHERAQAVLAEGLVTLGVLDAPDPARARAYTRHSTGHFLGLDTHDVGRYSVHGEPVALEPGMVLTVEPGLYFPADDPAVPAALRGLGVRIEDDVRVTEGHPEVLTEAIPRSIAAIEAAMRALNPRSILASSPRGA